MEVSDLDTKYDELQKKYGSRKLSSIYNGGCYYKPHIAFVFMNPTGRNVASNPDWKGCRSPWIGTKQIWGLFYRTGLLQESIYVQIKEKRPEQWDPAFAEEVYYDIKKHKIYVTNFAKCTQDTAQAVPDKVYREYLPLLEQELSMVDPHAVVLFGNQVSSLFLRKKISVSQCRKREYKLRVSDRIMTCYPVYYPVGNGAHNIDKAIEDIEWILRRTR